MRLILPIGIVFALSAPSSARAQHEGHVLAEGTLDHVTADQTVIAVYLGRADA